MPTPWRIFVNVYDIMSEKQISLIAAGVAFFGILGIFPGMAAVIAIFGLLADPMIVTDQFALLEGIVPDDAFHLIMGQLNRLLDAPTGTLGWATIASISLALWSSRAGVAALIGGLNTISGRPPRNGLWQVAVSLTLTICLVMLATVALFAVFVLPLVIALLPMASDTVWLLTTIRLTTGLTALFLALGLIYRFGPAPSGERARWFTVGAVVVVLLWIMVSSGLSYYLENFSSYNEIYGSIGAVIGLLLWLYASAFLILFGAALNTQIHRKSKTWLAL